MQTRTLTEQLASVRAERDALLLLQQQQQDGSSSPESTEKLLSRMASVSQERDQLQEALQTLREEKQQLRAELEDKMETVHDRSHSVAPEQPRIAEKIKKKNKNKKNLCFSDAV